MSTATHRPRGRPRKAQGHCACGTLTSLKATSCDDWECAACKRILSLYGREQHRRTEFQRRFAHAHHEGLLKYFEWGIPGHAAA